MKEILLIVSFYFLIGGIALFRIRMIHPQKSKENVIKYFMYLFIVSSVLATIHFKLFPYLTLVLIYTGLYEIIKSNRIKYKNNLIYALISTLIYCAIALFFFDFSRKSSEDELLFVYIIVLVFDGFSQITGQLWGKHKLLKVSPGKTVEGTIGGLILSLLTVLYIGDELAMENNFPVALLIIVSALAGDLLASWNKRINGIKDYGTLLPAHGGILDRFDSLLLSGALYNAILQH